MKNPPDNFTKHSLSSIYSGPSTVTKTEKRGVIDVRISEATKIFHFVGVTGVMFDSDISIFENRIREIGAGNLLDTTIFGDLSPRQSVSHIVDLLNADDAEIDSYKRSNNEAWFLSAFLYHRFKIATAKDQEMVVSDSIILGRLIEWWRWRTSHEVTAAQAYERKEKAGEGSAKASQSNKIQRIESMLSAMEEIVSENPLFKSKSARQLLADSAIENAIQSDPKLWSLGKGQRVNYLSAMKTDEPFKERFEAMGLK